MKVRVLTNFRDKTSNLELRKDGNILNVTKERAEKLISLRLAEAVPEKNKEPSKQTAE